MAATGTSVAKINPPVEKKSMAPERTCDNRSLSPPSWLFGNTPISTLPPVSCLILAAASIANVLTGWVAEKPWPSFQE
jgi:hypothetical protein